MKLQRCQPTLRPKICALQQVSDLDELLFGRLVLVVEELKGEAAGNRQPAKRVGVQRCVLSR